MKLLNGCCYESHPQDSDFKLKRKVGEHSSRAIKIRLVSDRRLELTEKDNACCWTQTKKRVFFCFFGFFFLQKKKQLKKNDKRNESEITKNSKKKFKTFSNNANTIVVFGKSDHLSTKNTKSRKIEFRIVLVFIHWCIDAQTTVII